MKLFKFLKKSKDITTKPPLVSVIVICYNYGKYLKDAVYSVQKQSYSNIELIVVDGGSNDPHTLKILSELSSQSIRIERRTQCEPAGSNRNFGVSLSKGEFVCCLDADDKMAHSFIEKAVFHAKTFAWDIISTSSQCFGDTNLILEAPEYPTKENILRYNQIHTLALVRKTLWEQVGGMKDIKMNGKHIHEDWDFWMRCLLNGASAYNICKEPLMFYRKHGSDSLSDQGGNVPQHEAQREYLLKQNESLILNYKDQPVKHTKSTNWIDDIQNPQSTLLQNVICVNNLSSDKFAYLNAIISNNSTQTNWLILLTGTMHITKDRLSHWDDCQNIEVIELGRFLNEDEYPDFIHYLEKTRTPLSIQEIKNVSGILKLNECGFDSFLKDQQKDKQLTTRRLSLEVIPQAHDSTLEEVLICGLRTSSAQNFFDPNHSFTLGKWKLKNCNWAPSGKVWKGTTGSQTTLQISYLDEIQFLKNAASGRIILKLGKQQKTIDLHSQSPAYFTCKIEDIFCKKEFDSATSHSAKIPNYVFKEDLKTINIQILNDKNTNSHSNEVWIQDIVDENERSLLFWKQFSMLNHSWKIVQTDAARNGYALLGTPGEPLSLRLPAKATVKFLKHDWSGMIAYSVEGESHKQDLFSQNRSSFHIKIADFIKCQ